MAKLPLCIITTESRVCYPTYTTKNHSHSVEAHFQDGTQRVLLSFLHINVINTVVMDDHYKITS